MGGFSLSTDILECALRTWVGYLGSPVGKLLPDGTWTYSDGSEGETKDPFARLKKTLPPNVYLSSKTTHPFALDHIGGDNTKWMYERYFKEGLERHFAAMDLSHHIELDQSLFDMLSSKQRQQSWWAERKLCNADRILGFPLLEICGC